MCRLRASRKQVEFTVSEQGEPELGDAAAREMASGKQWSWPLLSLLWTISFPSSPPQPPQETRTKRCRSPSHPPTPGGLREGRRRWREDPTAFPEQIGTRAPANQSAARRGRSPPPLPPPPAGEGSSPQLARPQCRCLSCAHSPAEAERAPSKLY